MGSRRIDFVAPRPEAFLQAVHDCAPGAQPPALVCSDNDLCRALRQMQVSNATSWRELPLAAAAACGGTVLLTETGTEALAQELQQFADSNDVHIIAPHGARHFQAQALFLVTIPKSGTHLARALLRAFGYVEGGEHNYAPAAGTWYCLEYSNSHTRATDFFVDSVRRAPFGNRHHPFPRTPTVFLYRNPLDILVSEAMYYHRDGNALFSGYLNRLAFEDRVARLIRDPWLLGTLRDRLAGFVPWLAFENVIPISFEELVGPAGGGTAELQHGAVWALQLKLQIPGTDADLARRIYDTAAPTFVHGRIGLHRELLNDAHRAAVAALDQDFMAAFGFDAPAPGSGPWCSRHVAEFRRRPVLLAPAAAAGTPVLVEADRMFFNIVFFNGRYYGVPCDLGPIDISALTDRQRTTLPSHGSLANLRTQLALGPVHAGVVSDWYSLVIAAAIRRQAPGDRRAVRHPMDMLARLADLAERIRARWRRLLGAAE